MSGNGRNQHSTEPAWYTKRCEWLIRCPECGAAASERCRKPSDDVYYNTKERVPFHARRTKTARRLQAEGRI